MSEPNLRIAFHFVNGAIDRFEVDDAEQARSLTEQLNPKSAFSGHPLVIAEENSLTSYRLESVVRIDFSGALKPKWPYVGNATSVIEVSAETFERAIADPNFVDRRAVAALRPGVLQDGFTVLTLTNGQRLIWEVEMSSVEMVGLDANQAARRLFSAHAIHAEKPDGGGVMLINAAQITRISFYPGPPQKDGRIAHVRRKD